MTITLLKEGMFSGCRTDICKTLKEHNLLGDDEALSSYLELTPWMRIGGEKFGCKSQLLIIGPNGRKTIHDVFFKCYTNIGINHESDHKRYELLQQYGIPTPRRYYSEKRNIIEEAMERNVEVSDLTDENKTMLHSIGKIAGGLDALGFTLIRSNLLEELMCKSGSAYLVDLGGDLGEPNLQTPSKTAINSLNRIRGLPNSVKNEIYQHYTEQYNQIRAELLNCDAKSSVGLHCR